MQGILVVQECAARIKNQGMDDGKFTMESASQNELLIWLHQEENHLLELRHELHRNPELGHKEFHTTELIRKELASCGAEILPGRYETGVAAIVKGNADGPVVALREDIDALPIQERTGLPFASKVSGVSHACGHDIHTTALLGCAAYLCKHRDSFRGTVMLIFQCAEETFDGAATMMADGLFDEWHPKMVFGFHCAPSLPLGVVGICRGASNASCDTVTLKVIGKGGHGAHPDLCVDPIIIAANILTSLQTAISREKDPMQSSVLTIGSLHGGNAPNVIPNEVVMQGTLRTFDASVRNKLKVAIQRIAENSAKAMGGICEVTFDNGMPPLINSNLSSDIVEQAAQSVVGREYVSTNIKPSMGSDDFSCILEVCGGEGIQFLVGTADANTHNSDLGLHVAENVFPDAAILPAAAVLAQVTLDAMR